jgi:DNA (cytosine-5)-methyltransferase 1
MKYLSICSGIEAASVAFGPLGWKPLAFSEIEAFPRAVLQHHYPDTPLHGDFTELKDQPFIVDADLLCGGTPCQSFSVAGLRQSLADDRGNLTLQFVLLADAIDHLRHAAGREPAWILWENVPGVFSTNDNAFGAFLGGLVGRTAPIPEPAGGWTGAGVVDGPTRCAAWRILDAQHFGLAQRRKRVFVLARGGAGRWAVADALLPIIEGREWHPAPSRSKGEGVAATITSGAANGGPAHGARSGSAKGGNLIPEVTRPLTAAMGTKWNGNGDLESSLIPSVVGTLTANMVGCAGTPGYNETEHILPMLMRMREGKEGGGKGPLVSEDQSLTLATANDQVLAFTDMRGDNRGQGINVTGDIANTMHCAKGPSEQQCVSSGMQVRRLTPVECERLQGFPDGYTNIPWRGKPESPDGPRYKALGNSWAVPCARWIGERIKAIRP